MFDEFGQCLLTDFGIAKAASGQKLTGTGMSIGTPHYMSPEQARAQAIDGRSDIYSLGVVAYQCLTGTVPYDGEDSFSIGYKHITEPIPTPSLITADERRIFEVIKRMLMKDPADRFQSCEELVASIQGQPTAAPGAVRVSAAARRDGGGTDEHADGGQPERRRPADREPADHADRFAAGQPARHAARAADSARVADRSLAMRGGSGPPGPGSGWCWPFSAVAGAPSTTTSPTASRPASAPTPIRRPPPSRHDALCATRRPLGRPRRPATVRRRRPAPAPDSAPTPPRPPDADARSGQRERPAQW